MYAIFVKRAQSAAPSRRPLMERKMNAAEEKEAPPIQERASDGIQNIKPTATILSLWERKKASDARHEVPAQVAGIHNDSSTEGTDATRALIATPPSPVKDEAQVPVQDRAQVPFEDEAPVPVEDGDLLPVDDEAQVLVQDQAQVPVQDKAQVPADDEAPVPVEDEAQVPVQDRAQVLVKDEANSREDEAQVPVQDKAQVPVEDEAPVPVEDEAQVPVQDSAQVLVEDEAHSPVEDEVPVEEEDEAPVRRRSSRRRMTIISISDDDDEEEEEEEKAARKKKPAQKRKIPRLFETKADRKARADKKKQELEADEAFLAERRTKEAAKRKAQEEERAELARKRQRQLREMQTSAFGGGSGAAFFAQCSTKRHKQPAVIDLVNCTEETAAPKRSSRKPWTMPHFPQADMVVRKPLDVDKPDSPSSALVDANVSPTIEPSTSRCIPSVKLVNYGVLEERDTPLQRALDKLRSLPRRSTQKPRLWIDQHSRQFAGSARVALESLSEWLASRWGSAAEAASSEPVHRFIEYDEYFDSDDEEIETASHGASLIVGPVGTGKTAVSKAAAHVGGFEVLELDTSESCSAADLKSLFVEATQSHRLTSRTLLLIDIDAAALSADRSFARALRKLVLSAKCPVIATATCDAAADLADAIGCARHHSLSRVSQDELSDFLVEVVGRGNLLGGDDADWRLVGDYIAARANGDTRRAINQLQLFLATDCIQVDDDYVLEDTPTCVQGVAVATPDDDLFSSTVAPSVPEAFPATDDIECGAPRIIDVCPRQLSASRETTLLITAHLEDARPLSVFVGDVACTSVSTTRADGDSNFIVRAASPPPANLEMNFAQVLLVTQGGRRSDFAIADRFANTSTVEFVGSLLPRRRLRKNVDRQSSDFESESEQEETEGPRTQQRRRLVCDDDSDEDVPSPPSQVIPQSEARELPVLSARTQPIITTERKALLQKEMEVLSSLAADADVRSLSDSMRYHAIEEGEVQRRFTVGRGWPQSGPLASMAGEMLKSATELEEPEAMPLACQSKHNSTRLALETAQVDGMIAPRAHFASLAIDYAPALRSLVAFEAANAACSTRRRFVYSYSFDTRGSSH